MAEMWIVVICWWICEFTGVMVMLPWAVGAELMVELWLIEL
jgi:hypothetical protein